jgi:hypothetical protein
VAEFLMVVYDVESVKYPGLQRYFVIQTSLTKGAFPVSRFGAMGIMIILTVIVIVVFTVLVWGSS